MVMRSRRRKGACPTGHLTRRHIDGRALTGASSDQSPSSSVRPFGNGGPAQAPASAPRGRRGSSTAGGTKTWRAQYYVGGKPRSASLGSYPDMSLADAKEAAFEFDPNRAVASSEAGTLKDVAEWWIRDHVEDKKLRSRYEIERHLKVYVYPHWQKKPLFDIRRIDVNILLDHTQRKHGPCQADAVLRTIKGAMSWYMVKDDRYYSPIVKGMDRDKRLAPERSRKRILNDEEIRAVWKACSDGSIYGALVKMLLLTGQRLRKVAHIRWQDI
jgi:hypothetical protein